VVLLLEEVGAAPPVAVPDAYAIVPNAASMPQAMAAVEALRAAGCSVVLHAGGGSMKSQFKRADGSGAAFALVFGDDELAQGMVAVKPLRVDCGGAATAQFVRPLGGVVHWAAELRNHAA
jgi:histidyl-tRNA synthetase